MYISKINAIAADTITLNVSKSSVIDEQYLYDALTKVPVRLMDILVVPYSKIGLAFTVKI